MGSPSDSMLQNQQGKYIRTRENPFFDGLKRGNTSTISKISIFDVRGRSRKQKVFHSSSVIVPKEYTDDIQENVSYSSSKDSRLDIKNEAFGSENVHLGSSQIADDIQIEKPLTDNKRKQTFLGDSLPQCAASFYYGYSSRMIDNVESCESIQRLNLYLKACKEAVNAGVPGRFLRAVLLHGSDAGSFISTIMYAFYLNETDKSSQFCTMPIFDMKRVDLNSHAELQWLLNSCNVDLLSLLFIDEVDLSYYDLFGSLKVVLVNTDKLPRKLEALKDSVTEIFNCQKDSSCCACIAEKFASTSPKILAGKGFSRLLNFVNNTAFPFWYVCGRRLLHTSSASLVDKSNEILAGILLDTGNLTTPECTSVDRYMSTLLLNGAGRFGCNGLYHTLRSRMHGVSQLSIGQMLQNDFRKWTTVDNVDISGSKLVISDVGMSAVGISIPQLLSHDDTSIQQIILFQRLEKLKLLIIILSYDHHKNFKDMLISAESEDLMKNLLCFLDNHLPLHALYHPGLSDEMRAFTMNNVASRMIIDQLVQDFCATHNPSF